MAWRSFCSAILRPTCSTCKASNRNTATPSQYSSAQRQSALTPCRMLSKCRKKECL
jgi:hypothetical protein